MKVRSKNYWIAFAQNDKRSLLLFFLFAFIFVLFHSHLAMVNSVWKTA